MIVHTKTVWQLTDDPNEYLPLYDESYEYDGPLALADRAAQGQANQAQTTAANTAGQEGATAQNIQSSLLPYYKQEMNTQHGFSPTQQNEMLTYAEAGSGGATSGLDEAAKLEAARTGNTASLGGELRDISQNNQKTEANASEGIGAADVAAAKQLNQQGAQGEAGLYGADTTAMLNAMGIQTGDINAEVNAGNSGWFQNMTGFMNAAGNAMKGAGSMGVRA